MKEEKQHRESEIQIRDSALNTGTTLAEAVRTDRKYLESGKKLTEWTAELLKELLDM